MANTKANPSASVTGKFTLLSFYGIHRPLPKKICSQYKYRRSLNFSLKKKPPIFFDVLDHVKIIIS
jgi:hypothetical protein